MDAVHDRYASLELEEVSKLPVISLERLVGFLSCPKEGHGLKRCACVLLESGEVEVGEDCMSSPQDAKTCQPCIELPVFPTRPPQVRVPCNRWHLQITSEKCLYSKSRSADTVYFLFRTVSESMDQDSCAISSLNIESATQDSEKLEESSRTTEADEQAASTRGRAETKGLLMQCA